MGNKKKLMGVYLPLFLIERIRKFVLEVYLKTGTKKSQSEIVKEAVEGYLKKQDG